MIADPSPADPCLNWNQDCLATVVVLASCLNAGEMNKLLKKHSVDGPEPGSPPERLLEMLHEACHRDATLAETIAKKLDRRFSGALVQARGLNPADLDQAAQGRQWPLPLMWACFRQPSAEFRAAGRRLAHSLIWRGMKLHAAGPDQEELRLGLEEAARQKRALRQDLQKARAENRRLKREQWMRAAAQPAPRLAPAPVGAGKEEARLRRELAELTERNQALGHELATWRKLALSRENRAPLPQADAGPQACPAACRGSEPGMGRCGSPRADCPLAGRRVLVIGGLDRLETRYRDSVDQLGGKCIFHTGKIRGGCRRLKQTVAKADLVVFITTINSHAALSTVKAECKRCDKPFCALGRSGTGSLEQALLEWAV